jgi:hypothetical protein
MILEGGKDIEDGKDIVEVRNPVCLCAVILLDRG